MVRRGREQDLEEIEQPSIAPRFVSLQDASTYTGISIRTLREYMAAGQLKSYRAANVGDIRVTIGDLDALLGA